MGTALPQIAVLGAIAQTGLEIESAQQQQRSREADSAAVRVPIALIDSLLSELEVLNLFECERVPESLQPSLHWLFENCPVECPRLSVRSSPAHLIDALFDLQESLFALKGGDFRRRLQLDDERRATRHDS
jgi:hypothetical protein